VVGGVLVSCNHCWVVGKRGRLLAGGSFSGVGIVICGVAWALPGRWRSSWRKKFGKFRMEIAQAMMLGEWRCGRCRISVGMACHVFGSRVLAQNCMKELTIERACAGVWYFACTEPRTAELRLVGLWRWVIKVSRI
jgi:hypothetical protein